MTTDITTDDLRAAYDRARLLRLRGWTFERALRTPLILAALRLSARYHLRGEPLPTQIPLF